MLLKRILSSFAAGQSRPGLVQEPPLLDRFPNLVRNSLFREVGGDGSVSARELHSRLMFSTYAVSDFQSNGNLRGDSIEIIRDSRTGHTVTFASGGHVALEESSVPVAVANANRLMPDYGSLPEIADKVQSSNIPALIGRRPIGEMLSEKFSAGEFFQSDNSLLSKLTIGDFPVSVKLESARGYELRRALDELANRNDDVTRLVNRHGEIIIRDERTNDQIMFNGYGQIITVTMEEFLRSNNSLLKKVDSANRVELTDLTGIDLRGHLYALASNDDQVSVSGNEMMDETVFKDERTGHMIAFNRGGEVVAGRSTTREFLKGRNSLISKLALSDLRDAIVVEAADEAELKTALVNLAQRDQNVTISGNEHYETTVVDNDTGHKVVYDFVGEIVYITNFKGTRSLRF